MKRPAYVVATLLLLIFLSVAFTNADEPRYKNLKILPKNTNKKQMDSVMHHFTASLSVKCNFCHVFNAEQKSMDFASDANEHKAVARSMMRMTNRLNKKYFDISNSKDLDTRLEVTCFTCHHGKAEPSSWPPPPPPKEGGQQGPAGSAPAGQPAQPQPSQPH